MATMQPDLDVLVLAPTGDVAAYALGWYDAGSRAGLLEPVGTHPAWRRRGLALAVVKALTCRLAALGARRVTVGTAEGNRAATELYIATGYRSAGAWADFVRTG